MSRMTIEWE
ncbi:Protein of unknown function [Leuconostoc citreum]|nr:Protein of unknown function [Leuconostoc citreum]